MCPLSRPHSTHILCVCTVVTWAVFLTRLQVLTARIMSHSYLDPLSHLLSPPFHSKQPCLFHHHCWCECTDGKKEVWTSGRHPTFQFPAERFWRDPAEPSKVAGLELSARRVRYGFTTDGCHSISTPLGDFDSPGIGPTPSHWKAKSTH